MPSRIESQLYGEWAEHVSADGHVGEQALVEFSVRFNPKSDDENVIRLAVVPETRQYEKPTVATFNDAHLGIIQQQNYDPEFNYLPWSIVGYHCHDRGNGRWSFQLNCYEVSLGIRLA